MFEDFFARINSLAPLRYLTSDDVRLKTKLKGPNATKGKRQASLKSRSNRRK